MTVTVEDAFQIPLSLTGGVVSIAFVRLRQVDTAGVFGLVVIGEGVSLIVVALANEPAEGACRVSWIIDSALSCFPIPSGDVVPGNRAPENIRRICGIR